MGQTSQITFREMTVDDVEDVEEIESETFSLPWTLMDFFYEVWRDDSIALVGEVDGKIVCTLPEGAKVPVDVPKKLFAHNIKEFSNLAAILPEVYAENKNNF